MIFLIIVKVDMFKFLLVFLFSFLNFILINAEEKTSTKYFPVGELGEAWELPSDHLPVGGSVGNVHFVLWNILNTSALHHIEDNSQGLKNSLIIKDNIPHDELITLREAKVIESVLEMVHHKKYPRSLLALQETSEEVYQRLQEVLPANMKLFPESKEEIGHGDVFIYDADKFNVIHVNKKHYRIRPNNTMMNLVLREKSTGVNYRFVQSHVPGGPIFSSIARKELAEYVRENYDPAAVNIILGDMNRSADYFIANFENVFDPQPFISLDIPYPTHINTAKEASWIDNVFIATPFEMKIEAAQSSIELFESLQQTIDLLNSYRSL